MLQLLQQRIEPLEVRFPDCPIPFEPGTRLGKRASVDPPGPALRVLADADQPCPLEDLQVLGDGRLAHVERRRELGDRRVTEGETREDRPSRRIGERQEGRIEVGGSVLFHIRQVQ